MRADSRVGLLAPLPAPRRRGRRRLACTVGSLALVALAFTREVTATTRWQAALAVPLFALLPLAMGLPTLVFHGMEHSLHMLATLAFVALLGARLPARRQAAGLVALAFAIPLIRFESIEYVSKLGEPFTFGFDPAELPAYLDARGLALEDDLPLSEVARLYYPAAARPPVSAWYHVVSARCRG